MSIRGQAYIAGIYEHPLRKAPDKSLAQLHAEVAKGALADAGLSKNDVDGYFCAGDAPGLGPLSMAEYLGLKLRHADSTDTGGSSYLVHVSHAAQAIAAGKCDVALVTLAGRPRSEGQATGTAPRVQSQAIPDVQFEAPFGPAIANMYAMVAMRHMHEFGTTSEQLAWIKVAASHHAQYNEHAMLREVVSVEDVVGSPLIADPLHRLDCCVISDGGGAIIVTRPEIAKSLKRPLVKLMGAGEATKGLDGGRVDLTYSGTRFSGAAAFRGGRHYAVGHQVRVDLRQFHDHRSRADRGPRLLREGRGRPVRRGWQPHLRCRKTAVQHRRRRPLQQPSREPRWPHEGARSRAPVARRGPSQGAGRQLRPCVGERHGRIARHPTRQRDADPGKGMR